MSSTFLPKGSTIFVTGVNGYIASHIADQILEHGYVVRGSARDQTKLSNTEKTLLARHPNGKFEGVVLESFDDEDKLLSALKGADALILAAADVSFGTDTARITKWSENSMESFLAIAAKTPSIKRVVITSSSAAAATNQADVKFTVDETSWNDMGWKAAHDLPEDDPNKAFMAYSAGKIASEKAAWKFVKERKPSFTLNAVLPNLNIGPILGSFQAGSTASWVQAVYDGNNEQALGFFRGFPPHWYVDVRDTARLHFAATVEENVTNKRIFAYAGPASYADYAAVAKKIAGRDAPPPLESAQGKDISVVDNKLALELLKGLGRPGWVSLEDSIKDQVTFKAYEA